MVSKDRLPSGDCCEEGSEAARSLGRCHLYDTPLHGIEYSEQNHRCQKGAGVWWNGAARQGGWHWFEACHFHSVFLPADNFLRNTVFSA